MFASVEPSAAALTRAAFIFSNLGRNDKKDRTLLGSVFFVISAHFRCHFFQSDNLRKPENRFNFRSQVSTFDIID